MQISQLVLCSLLAIPAVTTTALADDETQPEPAPKTKTLAVDAAVAVPTGNWADGVGFGIGALARFEMPINPQLTFTARVGYIQHLAKEGQSSGFGDPPSSSANEIPLFGGLRYAFSANQPSTLYGAAELGLVRFGMSVDYDGQSMSNSETNLGMTIGGGYRSGKLDLRGGILMPDLGHAGDAIAVMGTVGFDLTTL